MESIFGSFFRDTAGVCGHENTFHANFMHQLLLSGLPAKSVAREYKSGAQRVDIALFADRGDNGWRAQEDLRIAIEFKGGAYNTRNALRDTIDADGYCDDIGKLATLKQKGIECWFVCIDVVELGISLSMGARGRVAHQCASHGIHFAYYAQGESSFLISRDVEILHHQLPPSDTESALKPHTARWEDCLPQLSQLLRQPLASEDTYTGMVYHALQCTGFAAGQVSLETYFSCAKGTGRMQLRPDLCVFNNQVKGRFNLYQRGDISRSNDGIKIGNLQTLIEVKGSSATERLSDNAFAKLIDADIKKLVSWRKRIQESGYLPGMPGARQPEYVMIAVDNRQKAMDAVALGLLQQQSLQNSIQFHYMSPPL
jgi:hypothetical protein